jgi:tRNA pseudouridine-54 N-methylase
MQVHSKGRYIQREAPSSVRSILTRKEEKDEDLLAWVFGELEVYFLEEDGGG